LENAVLNKQDGLDVVEGTVIDITQRKKSEAELRASEERFRDLFEKNLAGVYVSTLDGDVIDCNQSFALIFGYASRQELLAMPATSFYQSAADRESFIAELRKVRSFTNKETL